MHEMGYRLEQEADDSAAPEPEADPTPAGVLPPIPLSPIGPDGLPAGLGMAPVGR